MSPLLATSVVKVMVVKPQLLRLRDICPPDLPYDFSCAFFGCPKCFKVNVYPFHFNIRVTYVVPFGVPNLQLRKIIASFVPLDIYLVILHSILFNRRWYESSPT